MELTGNADDQSRNSEVWDVAYQRVDAELAAGRDIVVDATSARRGDRMKLVARCRQGADRIVGMWFTAPYRVCLHRNQQRERVVPEFSMGLMAGWLEAYPPSEAEGFDESSRSTPASARFTAPTESRYGSVGVALCVALVL